MRANNNNIGALRSLTKSALTLAVATVLLAFSGAAKAGTLYWIGTTTANLTWPTAANWYTNAGGTTVSTAAPVSTDDTIFNITGVNNATTCYFGANVAANSITFTNTGTTSFRGNTSGTTVRSLTLGAGGITMNPGAGSITFSPASANTGVINLMVGAAQGWTNNSASTFTVTGSGGQTAATVTNQLTLAGSGPVIFSSTASGNEANFVGNGGIVKTGTGMLTWNLNGAGNRVRIGGGSGGNFTMQQGTLLIPASGYANCLYMILCDNTATNGDYTQTGGAATNQPTDAAGNGLYIGLTASNNITSTFAISGGSFTEAGVNTAVYVADATGTSFTGNLNIGGGAGAATFTAPAIHIGAASGNTANVTLITNGMLTTLLVDSIAGTGNLYFNGGTLQVSGSFTSGNTILSNVLTAAQIKDGGGIIDCNGMNATIAQGFANYGGSTGSLTKINSGTLTLSGANTYTGPTVISAGTLALSGSGSLASTVITNNSVFDVSGTTSTYHLTTGQTLFGPGSINGPLTVDSGAVATFGGTTGTGTGILNCNGNLALNGTGVLRLYKTGGTNDVIAVTGGSLALNGVLEVHNVGGTINIGDQFQVFTASGGISGTVTVTGDSPTTGQWDTSQITSGILKVSASGTPPAIVTPLVGSTNQCSAMLTVGASGTSPLVYYWKTNNVVYAITTNISSISPALAYSTTPYQVSVVVSNSVPPYTAASGPVNVVVNDTTAPVITLLGNNPVFVLKNGTYVEPGITAADNCGGAVTLTTNITVNTAVLGTYTNIYTATDGRGNIGTNTRTVAVVTSFVWTNSASDSWTNSANWLNNYVADGFGIPADFSTLNLSGGPVTVTLDGARTIGGLWFADQGDANGWTLNTGGGDPLTLAAQTTPVILVSNQTATVNAALAGTNGLKKTGVGMLVLGDTTDLTGDSFIESGTLQMSTNSAFSSTASLYLGTAGSTNGPVTLQCANNGSVNNTLMGAGVVIVGSNTPSATPIVVDGNPNTTAAGEFYSNVHLQNHDLIITNSGNASAAKYFYGQISGTGDVYVSAVGVTRFTYTTNTFVGNVYITKGRLQTGLATTGSYPYAIPANSDVSMSASTTFGIGASSVNFGALNGDATATVGANIAGTGHFTSLFNFGNNNHSGIYDGTISGVDLGGGNPHNLQLIKNGTGTQTLNGVCTSTNTSVLGGTFIINNSFTDLSAITVSNGAMLGGVGTVNGGVNVLPGGTLAPGTNLVGSLTINGDLTLAGNLLIKVNKSLSPGQSNDLVVVSGSLANSGAGTLTVANLGPALAFGNKFYPFNGSSLASGGTMSVTGAGAIWNNNLVGDGSISVASLINTTPTNITAVASGGNTLTLSWPSDHLGWHLQYQTNSLGTNWVTIPGSDTITSTNITINPANRTAFYRMVYP